MYKREKSKEVKIPTHCQGCIWGSAKSGIKWICSMPRCVRDIPGFKRVDSK